MSKQSFAAIQLQLDQAIKDRDANLQTAQNAINIANNFGAKLSIIEELLAKAPFIQKGFFKKVWWVITNIKQLSALIEDIIKHIKEWRDYVNQLNVAAPKPQA